ncbi:MAG: class I SAM-dependent methyltransferase [Deltaproteobacteria bacterium]|nr:class I SAM-dependent methyltransferase [Deltaproteobacteria bacterium]
MKLIKYLAVFLLVIAISAFCFALGWGFGYKGYFGWIRSKDYASLPKPSLAETGAEKRILSVLHDIHSPGQADPLLGRFLRILVEAVNAKNVVEIGTSNGYSALWISLGLRATGGKLITHEIMPDRAATARSNFERAGVEDIVTVVVGDAHQTITAVEGPIDILFIDAEKSGYFDYLNKLLPKVRPGGLILADSANKPSLFPDFIKAITTDQNLETIGLEMRSIGISLSLKKR